MHAKLLSTLVAAVLATGCGGFIIAQEDVARSWDTGSSPLVVVSTFNGAVSVNAGAGSQVRAIVTKTGRGWDEDEARDDLKNVDVRFEQSGDTIRVTAWRLDDEFGPDGSGAEVSLEVPAGAALDIVTSNGSVEAFGVRGVFKAKSSNGHVRVDGGAGTLDVETSNGSIDLTPSDAVLVNAHTSNGSMTFRGSLATGNHAFETSNGSIHMRLPGSSRFTLDADTSNGSVECELPIVATRSERTELEGAVNGDTGSTRVRLHTSNGAIDIERL